MKQIINLLLLFFALGVTGLAQTRSDVTMMVDDVERKFIVVRPSGAAPAGGYPVVFMFHGTGGDGQRFYMTSSWKEKGEAESFVTVFPSSLRYCFRTAGGEGETSKWNNGEAQQVKCAGVVLKDDVRFVRMMVDTITRMLPIDRGRIYAAGFSNGGGFVSKLAVEMSDVFAAVGAAAGPLNRLDSATPRRYVPIAYFRGDEDNTFIEKTGLPAIPFNDSCLIYFDPILRGYRGAFNLAGSYIKDSSALALAYLYNTPASTSLPSSELLMIMFKGLAHEYPNGTNYPMTAADVLWPFFNRHQLSSMPSPLPAREADINLYPNPATDYLVVDGEGAMTLTLSTMLGERVYTASGACGSRIALPGLTRGLYVAEIVTERGRGVRVVGVRGREER